MNLAGLLGNGAGLLCLGLGIILMKSDLATSKASAWVLRVVMVLMLAGGAGLTSAGIGTWIMHIAGVILGWFGTAGTVIAALVAFFLLLTVGLALWKKPSSKAAYMAAVLPFALALMTGGILGQIGDMTQQISRDGSAQVSNMLTGR